MALPSLADVRSILKDLAGIPEAAAVLQRPRVRKAVELAEQLYTGRTHWTGLPLHQHCVDVLKALLAFKPDEDTVIACILHHSLDSKAMTLAELEEKFGAEVRGIISGEYLLYQLVARQRRLPIDHVRLMLVRLAEDARSLFLFLCDRAVTLQSVSHLSPIEQRRLAREAMRILAPVAARLGIYALKHLLEQRAFPILYPSDAEHIDRQQSLVRAEFGAFLKEAAERLQHELTSHGVACTVEAREKQPYAIFNKMTQKGISELTAVYDLFALRVIVEKEEECYLVLGTLHRIAHAVPNRFKDYIAFPKPNGYQSLHTTLTGLPGVPSGIFTEVQIRTQRMHAEAEYGIAAHWNYKEGGSAEHAVQRFQMMRAMDRHEFIQDDRESFVDNIFVLTPKGDVIELPEGATPLDFAFHVHTDVGLNFRTARVNGEAVPMHYTLENGDVVEIVKSGKPQASPRWIKMLKTASARSRLRRYLQEKHGTREADTPTPAAPKRRPASAPKLRQLHIPTFRIVGTGIDVQLPLKPALCCKPEHGKHDNLVGIITRAGVIRVHRSACKLIRQVNGERKVGVEWS